MTRSRSQLAVAVTPIDSIREELKGSPWYHEQWTKEVLDQIESSWP